MSVSRLLMWTLALATLAWAVWAYAALPERIPLHFGIDGTPDRWGDRSLAGWLLLPLVGIGMAALMDGVGQWALRNPEKQTINLPQSDAIMALPVERRLPVLRRAIAMTNAVAVLLLVAFAILQIGDYAAALGAPSQGWTVLGVGICLTGPLAVLVWGITSVSNEIDRQRRET
ncbi:MAG: DUF1648 domain-containing protein [Bacteroidota bacterium]